MTTVQPEVNVNWNAFATSLKGVLAEELVGVLEGADQDIQNYLVDLSQDLTRALRENKPEIVQMVQNQAKGLLNLNRLRVAGANVRILDRVLSTVLSVGTALLGNMIVQAVGAIGEART